MDDLDLQPASHRRPSEKLPVQPGAPVPQNQAPQRPAPAVQSVPPVRHFDAPPAAPRQPMNIVPVIVGVAALGAIAYFIFGKQEEAVVEKAVETAKVVETKKVEKIEKEEETRKVERQQEIQREEAQKQRDFALEKEKIRAAEREALRQKNLADMAAATKEREALALKRKTQYAIVRMSTMKNRYEADLRMRAQNIVGAEQELKNIGGPEKAEGQFRAAKNQLEYAKKKVDETTNAYNEVNGKFGPKHETTAIYKARLDTAQREVQRIDGMLQKASAERQKVVDIIAEQEEIIRQNSKDIAAISKTLNNLRNEPDYQYMLQAGLPIDAEKTVEDTFTQLRGFKGPGSPGKAPSATTAAPASAGSEPVAAGPGVTVATKKEKITIYTMKDGKKISAVKAVDADDQLSLKTVDGKFVSIFKEDIVKQEEAE